VAAEECEYKYDNSLVTARFQPFLVALNIRMFMNGHSKHHAGDCWDSLTKTTKTRVRITNLKVGYQTPDLSYTK